MMKKIFVVALIALSLFVTACGKSNNDDTQQEPSNETLVGRWYLVYSTDAGEVVTLTECDKNENYTFTESEYTFEEALNTSKGDCPIKRSNGSYVINENNITLNDVTRTFSISGKRLTLSFTEKNDDGEDETSIDIYEKR